MTKIVTVIALVMHSQMIVSSVLVEILDLKKIMLMTVMKIVSVQRLKMSVVYVLVVTQV